MSLKTFERRKPSIVLIAKRRQTTETRFIATEKETKLVIKGERTKTKNYFNILLKQRKHATVNKHRQKYSTR